MDRGCGTQLAYLEQRLRGIRARRRRRGGHRAAIQVDTSDHRVDQRARGELGGWPGADLKPVTHDRDLVTDLEDLSEPVRDEQDGHAAARQLADRREQLGNLVVSQRTGRLVQDEDLRLQRDGPGDLNHLLLVRPQPADDPARIVIHAKTAEDLAGPGPAGFPVDAATSAHQPPHQHVLRDAQVLRDGGLLRNHCDPLPDRVERAPEARGPPFEADQAAVRLQLAGQDTEQRGLPASVLPDQRVHCPRPADRQVRAAQGADPGIGLLDAGQLK